MLRHEGKKRTFVHNMQLAAMLSFVAGIVNVSGVLALGILTTNLTGHFAFFSEYFSQRYYHLAWAALVFILVFFLGAWLSALLIELFKKKNVVVSYVLPLFIEVVLLTIVSVAVPPYAHKQLLAVMLLFAMGMQNALVTRVSNAVVRTTHLTGLFTDLGIICAQLLFRRRYSNILNKLMHEFTLKLAIVICFFLGCTLAGVLYGKFLLKTLWIAIVMLIIAMLFDHLKLTFYQLRRRMK